MGRQPRQTTCQWCNQGKPYWPGGLVTVSKPYGSSGHMDGPFLICRGRCLPLAEHFGYQTAADNEQVGQ